MWLTCRSMMSVTQSGSGHCLPTCRMCNELRMGARGLRVAREDRQKLVLAAVSFAQRGFGFLRCVMSRYFRDSNDLAVSIVNRRHC